MRLLLVVALGLLAAPALAKPPRLTVVIAVDSMGSDVFLRNRVKMKGGFARLLNEGAFFPVVHYDTAECVTAAGHATLSTGTTPSRHGVVGNRLVNRVTGKQESIFADPGHPVLDAPPAVEDSSPAALLAETVADRLKMTTSLRGKAIIVSGKGRSALALAGRLGEPWWFHEQTGRFVTGTYYRKEVPAWVKAHNDKKPGEAYFGKAWELVAPQKDYTGDDDRPFESDWYGMARTFPHPLSGGVAQVGPPTYSALASSPFLNDAEVDFAKAAIEGEQLGKDDVPDLLMVSFSAVDRVYHLYGPYSWEMQDMMQRLDKSVGDLLAAAEKAAGGKQNLVVALTADHGGAAIPEEWAALGLDGVRVDPGPIQRGLTEALLEKFKVPGLVKGLEETDVYLDLKAIADKKLDEAQVKRFAAAWLGKVPDVQLAISRDDLEARDVDPLVRALRLGFHPERSGDVLIVMKPYHVFEPEPKGTSHGTPYAYDAEVPLFLFGRGVKPGVYADEAHAVDVAPTLSALMEQGDPSMCTGKALAPALALPR